MRKTRAKVDKIVARLRARSSRLNVAKAATAAMSSSTKIIRDLRDKGWLDPKKLEEQITD